MILSSFKIRTIHSLWIFAASWSLLILVKFVPFVPQPESIIGYLWKYEFAIGLFLGVFLIIAASNKWFSRLMVFEKNEFYFIVLPILAFTIWSFLSVLWSRSERHALHHSLLWGCYLVFYLIARKLVTHSRLLSLSTNNVAIVLGIFGILCFSEYLMATAGGDSSNIGFRYSKFSEIAILILPVLILSKLDIENKQSIIQKLLIVVLWLLVLCSFARTQFLIGIVSLVAIAIIVFVRKFERGLRNRVLISIFSMVLITVFVNLLTLYSTNKVSTITRLTDKSDKSSQDSIKFRPLMAGISFEMFRNNPIFGVGADNFLLDYKDARTEFSKTRTEQPLISISEDIVPERSHNELVQILAELGTIGVAIIAVLLFGILKMTWNLRKCDSPIAFGSIIGIFAFLLCSLATSFSFRVPINGLCFFFVLAIAASKLFNSKEKVDLRNIVPMAQPVFVFASLLFCISMVLFSSIRGANLYYVYASQTATEEAEIEQNIFFALRFDKLDCVTNYQYARFLVSQKRYNEAAEHFRVSIDNGIPTSTAYFDLAGNQILAGENENANATFVEAINVYPRSVFLRTTFAKFLEDTNQPEESNIQFDLAAKLNESDAKSWWLLLAGDLTAVKVQEANATKTMDLQPLNGVYAVLDYQKERNPSKSARR
jgi:O-antigen ligase